MRAALAVAFVAAAAGAPFAGYTEVYFRRMRKAGSSTAMSLVHKYAVLVNKRFRPPRPVDVASEEFKCLSSLCQKATNTFHITNVREPLGRLASEYWWRKASPGQTSNASLWRRWIDEYSETDEATNPISRYQSDPYTKALSGRCPCHYKRSSESTRHQVEGAMNFEPGGCSCPPNFRSASDEDLAVALERLRGFDAIAVVEHFKDPAHADWLLTLLFRGPPPKDHGISLAETHLKHNGEHHPSVVPEEVRDEVRRRNARDGRLYAYAERRVRATLACFRGSDRSYANATACYRQSDAPATAALSSAP